MHKKFSTIHEVAHNCLGLKPQACEYHYRGNDPLRVEIHEVDTLPFSLLCTLADTQ